MVFKSDRGGTRWLALNTIVVFAICAAVPSTGESSDLSPLASGMYAMKLDGFGATEVNCSQLRGSADATIQGRTVVTSFFQSLELGVDQSGSVSGQGVESVTGWGLTATLEGKQTGAGYSGTFVTQRRGIAGCDGNWMLLPGVPLESGTYILTVKDKTQDPKLSCKRLEGTEELEFDEGRGSPGIFAGLRATVFSDGWIIARGYEAMIYSMPVKLTGMRSAAGYEGEYSTNKFGYRCAGIWALRKRE